MAYMEKKYTDAEWLREKYVSEKLSTAEISDLCDVTKETIRRWLNNHDIDTRSKSEAAKLRVEKYPHTVENFPDEFVETTAWDVMSDEEIKNFRERLSDNRTGDGNPMWDVTGEDHPQWKDETESNENLYQTKAWEQARKDALNRDDHECQVCGTNSDLHVHHIIPVTSGGPRYRVDNLVTLCDTHHREWEGMYIRPDTRHEGSE